MQWEIQDTPMTSAFRCKLPFVHDGFLCLHAKTLNSPHAPPTALCPPSAVPAARWGWSSHGIAPAPLPKRRVQDLTGSPWQHSPETCTWAPPKPLTLAAASRTPGGPLFCFALIQKGISHVYRFSGSPGSVTGLNKPHEPYSTVRTCSGVFLRKCRN